jgi:uncharacterized membrane protein
MRLAGHPLHPTLVHFPLVFWTTGVALDLGGLAAGRGWVWQLGFGCYALGVATAVIAMLAGFLELMQIPLNHPARDPAVSHMLAMSTAWLLFVLCVALRASSQATPPSVWAITAAIAAFLVMMFGGWLGRRLVYRFGVGVRRPPARDKPLRLENYPPKTEHSHDGHVTGDYVPEVATALTDAAARADHE